MKPFYNILGLIFSTLLSFLLYIFIIILLLVLSIKKVFSFNTINKLVQNIEVKSVLKDIDENNEIINMVYKSAEEYNIDNKTADKLMNSYYIKYLFSIYIYGGVNYLTNSDESMILTEESFNEYVNRNINYIIDDINIKYSEQEKNYVVNVINKNSKLIIENIPDTKSIVESINDETLSFIRSLFNEVFLYIIIGIILLIVILIIICRMSLYKGINWVVITILFSCLICIIVGLLPMFNFSSLIPGLPNYINNLISSSSNIITNCFLLYGVLAGLFAILLLIMATIIKKKTKNKKIANKDLDMNLVP